MESLQAAIASTCPVPFSGVTGGLFLNAITAAITAHCLIVDDNQWPKDSAKEVIEKGQGNSYDFIIVGAGTAGSVVASLLSQFNPDWSILLVEAGDDPGVDSEIPAFLFLNQNSNNDWNYMTEPDGRSCLGFNNNKCIWSKGKGMGGSSSINAMLYIRGHPNDLKLWEESGNIGWGYQDLISYFKYQENLFNISDPDFQGYDYIWYTIIDEAWKEIGLKTYQHYDHEAVIGTKKARVVIKNGKRLNTAAEYLKRSNNVVVMKNTEVKEIIIDSNRKRANAIRIQYGNNITTDISAKEEIILSAGSIATPQILMRSGIGPQSHLKEIDIDCLTDLPVGKNLQDHILFPLFLKTNLHTSLDSSVFNLLLLQYIMTKSGPISNIGITDYMGFINTRNDSNIPDVQFHYTYFPKNDSFVLRRYLEGIGYKNEIILAIEDLNSHHDFLGIYPTLLHPKSKGEILLDTKNQYRPIIKTNYLDHPDDMLSLLNAINFVGKLQNTRSFKELGIELLALNIPDCSQIAHTREYWECYIKHMATTIYHPVGTAKMGSREDKTSVVNKELLVHEFSNLRVVDASIMPYMPSANTMAATLAIAQKAVDIVKQKYVSVKDEL